MKQFLSAISIVVPDYDEAIEFYVKNLGFDLIEDTIISAHKRWVLISPKGSHECKLLLAKASNESQISAIGNQTGGRVFLFLQTDNFYRDYENMVSQGVNFLETPRNEPYGMVVVFQDPFGNKWDLIQSNT